MRKANANKTFIKKNLLAANLLELSMDVKNSSVEEPEYGMIKGSNYKRN